MRFFAIIIGAALTWIAGEGPAQASGDGGCPLQWKLNHSERSGCNNMAIMHPGNDTRANLILMLRDRQPIEENKGDGNALFYWNDIGRTFYPKRDQEAGSNYSRWGISRCQTNETGRDAFVTAVRNARRLPEVERQALIGARQMVAPDCDEKNDGMDDLAKVPAVASRTGKAFKTYLTSALDFYRGDFDAATIGFSSLIKAKDKWLGETALYMIARSELNRSQAGAFGSYGFFEIDDVDSGAIANADRGFKLYLQKYPAGEYAGSAQGLLRRVYWLSGDSRQLTAQYANIWDQDVSNEKLLKLIAEVDDKMLPGLVRTQATDDPMFLAIALLYRMRDNEYDYYAGGKMEKLSLADLERHQSVFANRPELFSYLKGVHAFYVAKEPAKVLKLIPDAARQANFSYLQFSRQVLRGMALDAVGDRNARGFWKQMLTGSNSRHQRAALELALAMNMERGGAIEQVFASNTPIQQQVIRDILLLRVAGPDMLRAQASNKSLEADERNLALYTLLYKNLTRGRYSDFLNDIKKVPAGAEKFGPYYGFQYEYDFGFSGEIKIPVGMFGREVEYSEFNCPQLKQTVASLAQNAQNQKARLCLADYLRIAGFDGYWLDKPAKADELGGSKSLFPGKALPRLELYKDLLKDRRVKGDTRAYTLYRAIWCYGSSGKNSCGGTEVPESQRASWFRDLKRNHGNTQWAKQLKYYW